MSEIRTVEIRVTDLDAIEVAAERVGLRLVRGQQRFRGFDGEQDENGVPNVCEHAIVVPGRPDAYSIGLVRSEEQPDGWELRWDDFDGSLSSAGPDCGQLLQQYGIEAATRRATAMGWSVEQQQQQDGTVQLVCSPGAAQATWDQQGW